MMKIHIINKAGKMTINTVIRNVKGKFMRSALAGVLFLVLASPSVNAISPLDDVPSSSTPIAAVAAPDTSSYGNLTGGAGGIVDSEGNVTDNWIATTDLGYIHKYAGQSHTASIFTGISGLSGAVYLGKDSDGNDRFALSAGKDIYEGILADTWSTDNILGVNGISSDLTDVSFYNGNYFAPTKSNGIIRIDPESGDSENIGSGAYEAIEMITFMPGVYTSDMEQIGGLISIFNEIDSEGTPLGSGTGCNLNNGATIEGVAYYGNGNIFTNMAVIQAPGTEIHDNQLHDNSALAYMDNMQAIDSKTLQADINNSGIGDGIVDIQDLTILIDEWLTAGVYANFNDEDMVDLKDFSIMADEWLMTESWYGN